MLESKAKTQGQDLDLFSTFIENGKIKESALNSYAKKMPDMVNQQEFLAQIPHKDKQGYSTIQTPIGNIKINLNHAWNHLNKGNTYKKDRSLYSGAFLDTLTDPLFIVKQEYTPNPKVSANAREMQNSKPVQTRDTESIAQDSYVKIPINTLDETKAKQLGFRIPQKTTRSITPSEVIHTLKRHGENSPMVKNGNQKAVTLDEIAKYQSYADNAQVKQESKDKVIIEF